MSDSDKVSLLALIVSLVALIVASLQLLQQVFGTAEGWRRCDYLVMGPWAKLRRSPWRWGEFRYETRYTTPEFRLTSGDEPPSRPLPTSTRWTRFGLPNMVKHYRESYTLLDRDKPDEVQRSMILKAPPTSQNYHNDKRARAAGIHLVLDQDDGREDEEEGFVTWIALIRELSQVWRQYQTLGCEPKDWNKRWTRPSYSCDSQENAIYVEVRFREHSWDMMPADVIRPLASVSMGHLVVLVKRLEMDWTELRSRSGFLRASGPRGNLNSIIVPGLGTVVQFNFKSTYQRIEYPITSIIPSVSADKMMCGILPAVNDLMRSQTREFRLIDDSGQPSLLADCLLCYDIPETVRNKIMVAANNPATVRRDGARFWQAGKPYHSALFDVICLLCPFVPVPGCSAINLPCPLPMNQGEAMRTPFHFWEGRRALLDSFRKYRDSFQLQSGKNWDYLQQLGRDFETLETKYPEDFYRETPRMRISGLQGVTAKLEMLFGSPESAPQSAESLQGIHERASAFFEKSPSSPDSGGVAGVSFYSRFVGAHLTLATLAGEKAYEQWDDGKNQPQVDWGDRKVNPHVSDFVLIGRCYSELLPSFVEDVRRRCGREHLDAIETQKAEIELAWWSLVVRGISWCMSVRCDFPAEVIPSSFYEDSQPVWIM